MQPKEVLNRLRQFDAYPKTLEDFRVKTYAGAAVTIISGLIMFILFVSELNFYLTTEVHPELFVDISRGQKLKINIDITFPRVSCTYLTVDAMDVSGESQNDVDTNLFKTRLDMKGDPIKEGEPVAKEDLGADKSADIVKEDEEDKDDKDDGDVKMTFVFDGSRHGTLKKPLDPNRCESCFGAETTDLKCCNTCDDVREAYRRKGWAFTTPEEIEQCKREGYAEKMKKGVNEGCRMNGHLQVNKVAGNFHFAPGKSFQQSHVHVHDVQAFAGMKFNMTHNITHLSFGDDYPGLFNPLDKVSTISEKGTAMFQYFVKIVPTTYVKVNGDVLYTNQYSVTKHKKQVSLSGASGEQGLPGTFFIYELSPMMVKYTETNRSFMHFLTGVCAIIGGVFTVAGLIDALIYHSAKAIQKKMEIGKLT